MIDFIQWCDCFFVCFVLFFSVHLFGSIGSSLYAGSLVETCGTSFPDQEFNLGPLYWVQRVLATGPPWKSLFILEIMIVQTIKYCCLGSIYMFLPWLWKQIYFCSVTQSCPTLCDPMDCSTLGFPVLEYLLKFAQTHVHWISDAIQPSRPLKQVMS